MSLWTRGRFTGQLRAFRGRIILNNMTILLLSFNWISKVKDLIPFWETVHSVFDMLGNNLFRATFIQIWFDEPFPNNFISQAYWYASALSLSLSLSLSMAFNTATKRKVADLILLIYCCVCGCLRLGMLKIRIRFGGGLHCRHFAVVSNLKRRLQISCLPEPQLTDNISNNIVTRRYRSLFLSSCHSEGFFLFHLFGAFFFIYLFCCCCLSGSISAFFVRRALNPANSPMITSIKRNEIDANRCWTLYWAEQHPIQVCVDAANRHNAINPIVELVLY